MLEEDTEDGSSQTRAVMRNVMLEMEVTTILSLKSVNFC